MKTTFRGLYRTALSLLLCVTLLCLCSGAAFAQDEGESGLADPAKLQEIVDGVIAEKGLNPENVSVGYCYLETGDTWYYNEDTWYYAASVYKVPLMMLVAEKVYNGELTQDSEVSDGISLAEEETYILTYSNNDFARDIRFNYFGGDDVWVPMTMKFSSMPEADYDPSFLSYRYFSVRYITDVLKTLATEPERFPNVIDCLLEAEPGGYFRTALEGQYKIAQKYGAYEENDGTNNNHTVGIIYTPNPIILSVMTKNVTGYESVIGEIAKKMTDYTLVLDTQLDDYRNAIAEAAAAEEAAKAEAERKAAEEAAQKAAEEAARVEAEQKALADAAHKEQIKKWLFIIGGSVLGLAVVGFAVSRLFKRPVGSKSRPVRRETVAAGRVATAERREPQGQQYRRDRAAPPRNADNRSRTTQREDGTQYRPRH